MSIPDYEDSDYDEWEPDIHWPRCKICGACQLCRITLKCAGGKEHVWIDEPEEIVDEEE